MNTWYTYTVNKDGVYTLKIVADAINKAEKIKTAQYHGVGAIDIDKKHVSLPGAASGSFSKVYGNDASIYLTAELKKITTPAGVTAGIIDDVDNVTTGVKNANLTTWTEDEAKKDTGAEYAAHGVYTLYKDNGYVIAAVVVGEDDYASKNLVYAHEDDIEWESYDKTADEWTWTRKVISNGEEIEIKEVGDSLTYLSKMNENNWYQVKYNAKGEVIEVLDKDHWDLDPVNADGEGEYVTDITKVEASINEYDTVLFTALYTDDTPSLKGSTLYVTTKSNEGFFVAEDAKVVLIQTNDRKETTTYETGVGALEDMIDDLNAIPNSDPASYKYTISAILEDGAATVVIIRDEIDATGNQGTKPVSPENENIDVTVENGEITVAFEPGKAGTDEIAAEIVRELNALGYEDVAVQVRGGKVDGAVATKNSIEYTFTVNLPKEDPPAKDENA